MLADPVEPVTEEVSRMNASDPARLFRADDRVDADPTPGMRRERAIEVDGLWAGLVRTAPGMTSGWHHHGDYETSIYVAVGNLLMESGPGGSERIIAVPGDFVHVPKGAIHRETNPGDSESHLVVVRAGTGQPTVNVDAPAPAGPGRPQSS
jgi:uncharacterized RmlC-like cupin family protein